MKLRLDKTKFVVFQKSGHLVLREKWVHREGKHKVVNASRYVGLGFFTKLNINSKADIRKAYVRFTVVVSEINCHRNGFVRHCPFCTNTLENI